MPQRTAWNCPSTHPNLVSARKKYPQLALAIIFGDTRFHQYLYGRDFVLYTDHKPLTHIFNPSRSIYTSDDLIQTLTLVTYNYTWSISLLIIHRPGKKWITLILMRCLEPTFALRFFSDCSCLWRHSNDNRTIK